MQYLCIYQYCFIMPVQLKRLIPLFAIFIAAFLLIRHALVPDTFGQYGHYRGAALEEIASAEPVYADVEDCKMCHDDVLLALENDSHSGLSCLICHGPGNAHVNDPQAGNIEKSSGRQFCARCHEIHPARPADAVLQVDVEVHNSDFENCIDCHHPHQVWEGLK